MATLSTALLQYTAKADEVSTAKIIFPMMENASHKVRNLSHYLNVQQD